jgi:hypothetical protein
VTEENVMMTPELFETGLRLDQYIASISYNKENFRANFIKAIEAYAPEDILFFRSLPVKVHVALITEDDHPDALRDVPLLSRISVEVGRVALRIFRMSAHPEAAAVIARAAGIDVPGREHLPVMVFYTPEFKYLTAHVHRIPSLELEIQRRHAAFIAAHPEIKDVADPIDKMTPITRTRLGQALYSMTAEQRLVIARQTVQAWRMQLAAVLPPPQKPAIPAELKAQPRKQVDVDSGDRPARAPGQPDKS